MVRRNQRKQNRRNNFRKNVHKTAPMLQMSKNINLFSKQTSAWVNITVPLVVYSFNTSDLYSFSGISDVRAYAFNTITAATEFTNFASVYTNYRLHSVSVLASPMLKEPTDFKPMLVVGIDPEASSGNPTNTDFILKDHNRLICPRATNITSCNFRFPGVGSSTNLWLPVGTAPSGSFYIGNNGYTGLFSTTEPTFDVVLSIQVEFNNIK